MKKIGIILFCCLIYNIYGQDIQLTQFYEADVLLNPALVGKVHHPRIMGHQRLQWPGVGGKYISSLIALDSYSFKYKSGFGIYFLNDFQGDGQVSSNEVSFLYAYDLHINDKWAFRAGFQGNVVQKKIDYTELYFPDQVTSEGFTPVSQEQNDNSRKMYGDMSTGGMLYTEKFWLGASWHHLTNPNQSFLEGQANLPSKFTFITGYKIPLIHETSQNFSGSLKDFYIFPMAHYKLQGKSDQFDIGLFGIDDQFKFGIWYRGIPFKKYETNLQNNESVALQVGWLFRHLQLSYSYDFIVSKLLPAQPRGAHEINIAYVFFREGKHHHVQKRLPCPDFQKKKTVQKMY